MSTFAHALSAALAGQPGEVKAKSKKSKKSKRVVQFDDDDDDESADNSVEQMDKHQKKVNEKDIETGEDNDDDVSASADSSPSASSSSDDGVVGRSLFRIPLPDENGTEVGEEDVILSRRKSAQRRLQKAELAAEQAAEEQRARQEKAALYNRFHEPTVRMPPPETALKQIATAGVVQLFNAINSERQASGAAALGKGDKKMSRKKRKRLERKNPEPLTLAKRKKTPDQPSGDNFPNDHKTSGSSTLGASTKESSSSSSKWQGLNAGLENQNWDL